MTDLTPALHDVYRNIGVFNETTQSINQPLIINRAITLLMDRHQAPAGADLQTLRDVSATVAEFAPELHEVDLTTLSVEDAVEVQRVTTSLLGLSASSPVQRTLNGAGFRLCPIKKPVDMYDGSGRRMIRSQRGSFVSNDDDLIYNTLFLLYVDSMFKSARRKRRDFMLIFESHPMLRERMKQRLSELGGSVNGLLSLSSPDEDDDA